MNINRIRLGEIAIVEISGVDKKIKDGEVPVKLCNFVDVYYNWAITSDMEQEFMEATARTKEIERFKLKRGQVALTKDSETRFDIGIATYIADDLDNVILGYHNALITPNPERLSGKYLNTLLHTNYARTYFANNASGSGQRYALSVDALNNFPIPQIPLAEQKRIGDIFSSIDKKIALNRAINDNLEAMAKQLYDYWFVQFDFPNEEGKPYKSSGGKMVWNDKLKREIPEGWEVKSVNEISSICRGVSYKPSDLQDNGVLILRGNNIENNRIIYDNNTAFLLPNMISDDQKIMKHDIIITMSSGSKEHIGKCAMFQIDSKHSFGAFLSKITPNKECPHFLFMFLISTYFKQKIKSICNGTGINNLTNQTFNEVKLAYPNINVLKLFEHKIQSVFDSIGNNDTENENLTKQRDELLPLLMNGQVSVNYHLSHD